MNAATMNLSPEALEVFKGFAADSGNWGGTPLVNGGNVDFTKENRGHLTKLKKLGLVKTWTDEGNIWLQFTAEGKAFAEANGLAIRT